MFLKKNKKKIKEVHVATTNGNFIGIASAPEYIFSVNVGNNINNGSYRAILKNENNELIGSGVNLAPALLRNLNTNTRLDVFSGKKRFFIRATERDFEKIETLNFGTTAGVSSWLTYLDTTKFKNLKTLQAFGSTSAEKITNFDGSKNPLLSILNLRGNKISTINISNCNELTTVNLDDNLLVNIVLPRSNKLINLYIYTNRINNIDLSYNTGLKVLQINNNALTSLNVNNNLLLTDLTFSNNQIVNLTAPLLNYCVTFQGHINKIVNFDFSKIPNAKRVRMENNELVAANVEDINDLTYLAIHVNNISVLNIERHVNLTDLYCYRNPINDLFLSNKTKLINLQFDRTNVSELNCPSPNLISLSYYETKVSIHNWAMFTKLQTLKFSVYTPNDTFEGLENLTDLRAFYISGSTAEAGSKINFEISYFNKINDIFINSGAPNVFYQNRINFSNFLHCTIRPNAGFGIAIDRSQITNLMIDLSNANWTGNNKILDLRGNCAQVLETEDADAAYLRLLSKGINVLIN